MKHSIESADDIFILLIRFSTNFLATGAGFKMRYERKNASIWSFSRGACGGAFNTPNGLLNSPSFPKSYPGNADCIYTISNPNGTPITLKFLNMDIEDHSSCRWDYLEIRNGGSEDSPLLGKLCGNEIPAPIHSTQGSIWIK